MTHQSGSGWAPWLRAAFVVAVCAMALDSYAAAYIKFDGIDGESKDAAHQGWSEIASFSHSIRRPVTASTGGTTRARAVVEDIVLVKELDKSSPKLAEALLTGKVIPLVTIQVARGTGDTGQMTYYAYELKNVLVTSYQVQVDANGGQRPVESISLNFEEIKVTYTEVDPTGQPKGNVEYNWKVEEGTS
ncbi:MAG: type VI secretion system tube protein Hcp [bacterium]|nr:type VI secretion system tube protein Hcp [bacterium]